MDDAKTIGLNDPLYSEIVDFLYTEAELIDDGRFSDWLELMTEDLIYRMPIRVNRGRGEGNEARTMAMYLCRRLGGYNLTEIGRVVGLEKYS